MRLTVLDQVSDPGHSERINEDALGATGQRAFVIDGATGLGHRPIMTGHGSDARWLAVHARDCFEELCELPVKEMVRQTNQRAKSAIDNATTGGNPEPWALPVAGFQMIEVGNGGVTTHGLGDCRLFILSEDDGAVFETSALRGNPATERERARRAIEKTGGLARLSSLSKDTEVEAELRAGRALYNTSGGAVWTLGTAPEAAEHVVGEIVPLQGPLTGLLCTDGFAAMVDLYNLYSASEFVEVARSRGLWTLLGELRRLEREVDPDGRLHPRYKVSDDATALLFRVEP